MAQAYGGLVETSRPAPVHWLREGETVPRPGRVGKGANRFATRGAGPITGHRLRVERGTLGERHEPLPLGRGADSGLGGREGPGSECAELNGPREAVAFLLAVELQLHGTHL